MFRILKIIIALLIALVLISGAVAWFARRKVAQSLPQDPRSLVEAVRTSQDPPAASSTPTPAVPAPIPAKPTYAVAAPVPVDPAVQLQADLEHIAMGFTERWGTEASARDISPVATLGPLMTARMRAYAATVPRKAADGGVFYAIQTKAVRAKEVSFSSSQGTAMYLVSAQRVERVGTVGNQRVWYQDLEVRLLREEGLWKVDAAYWKEQER